MSSEYGMVLTTVTPGDEQVIIDNLLTQQLAGCIQVLAIDSHYVWQDEICNDKESLLIIKTRLALYDKVEAAILQQHNYDVPQIVMVPFVDGLNPYLVWLDAQTQGAE
ncbi:divalent-cation tolerance protein CutA [Vibrio astriarenae]|jgi:periplasmic divalent cation tolerance protein|uniref:Divalent-cation tolerance protein CutA n=1 Tax=Vibrio agarivorans TaxID=153622 RepID=A0ABT7Y5C1_9VIBR|nr:divalent-cation tolerance protein CutA [Vibrio agarivorans]MDN2483249.1 divalent-cation tolerance protein CutA [Vibrio agarivorans]